MTCCQLDHSLGSQGSQGNEKSDAFVKCKYIIDSIFIVLYETVWHDRSSGKWIVCNICAVRNIVCQAFQSYQMNFFKDAAYWSFQMNIIASVFYYISSDIRFGTDPFFNFYIFDTKCVKHRLIISCSIQSDEKYILLIFSKSNIYKNYYNKK